MMSITVDKVVKAYIKLRNEKDAIMEKAKQECEEISANLDKLELWLRERSVEQGVDSFKTPHGTAFIVEKDYASVSDWPALLAWVRENEAFDVLTRGVSKTVVREYIQENNTQPPGVNYGVKREVQVRKPKVSAKSTKEENTHE